MFSTKTALTLLALLPSAANALKWDCWKNMGCSEALENHNLPGSKCLCNVVDGKCTSDGKPCFQAATMEECWAKGAMGATVWGDTKSGGCFMNKYDCWSDCDCSYGEKDPGKWYKQSNVFSTSAAMGSVHNGVMIDGAQACFNLGAASASVWGHSYYQAYARNGGFIWFPHFIGWETSNHHGIWYTCPVNPSPTGNTAVCPVGGSAWGDPHFKTLTGEIFDFQGECDLVFLEAPGLNMTIHVRTKLSEFKQWSFIESAALSINGEVIQVGEWGNVIVNDIYNADDRELPETVGGYPLELEMSNKKTHTYRILLGDGRFVELKSYKFMVGVTINLPHDHLLDSSGLLGSVRHNGEKLGRDGLTLFTDNDAYGKEWVVNPNIDPSLFQASAEHPGVCVMPPSTEKKTEQQRLGEKKARDEAIEACKNWHMNAEACIQDVMANGDHELAAGVY